VEHRGAAQLAFRNSAPGLRLYLEPVTDDARVDQDGRVDEYVRRWSGADRRQIGAHSAADLRSELWPWLEKTGHARDADDPALRHAPFAAAGEACMPLGPA
jgi:hypothetical protein